MTKEREALKLALEALEETRNALAWFYDSYPQDVTQKGNDLLPHVETVLTAIREALAEQPAQQQEPVAGWDFIEKMAAERYKVGPSHNSMFYRHAVVAGNGTQQLYLGRELECENMARRFAGAFLDGAFVMQSRTSPPASNQCKFPLCQNEDYQQALAEQIKRELYTGEPAQRKPLTPEWYAQWIRNNYQDYWNIATLCDEMTKAAHGIKEKNT